MRARLYTPRGQSGFTLTEMLVVLVFIGVLFAGFALVLSSTLKHNDQVVEESTIQTEVRTALDRLAADLRQAYSGDDDVSAVESIGTASITFLSPDRAEPFHLRRISYRLTGGTFERAQATSSDTDGYPWSIPALGSYAPQAGSVVNSTVFRYYDAGDAELAPATADPADVRTVEMTIAVQPRTSQGRQFTYQTSVTLRTPSG